MMPSPVSVTLLWATIVGGNMHIYGVAVLSRSRATGDAAILNFACVITTRAVSKATLNTSAYYSLLLLPEWNTRKDKDAPTASDE